VMLPQALRVIIPPMTNQYLNLTKNSSLAVAIGYPDVVSIANTALNQTGRAVECIAIVMLVYLTTSLGHLLADELVQQPCRHQGTLSHCTMMNATLFFNPLPRARHPSTPRARWPGSRPICSATGRPRWPPS
jgi:hypothetical protein